MYTSTLANLDGNKNDPEVTGNATTSDKPRLNGKSASILAGVTSGTGNGFGESRRRGSGEYWRSQDEQSGQEYDRRTVSLNSLFDEDIPVVLASPTKKRVDSALETRVDRRPGQGQPTRSSPASYNGSQRAKERPLLPKPVNQAILTTPMAKQGQRDGERTRKAAALDSGRPSNAKGSDRDDDTPLTQLPSFSPKKDLPLRQNAAATNFADTAKVVPPLPRRPKPPSTKPKAASRAASKVSEASGLAEHTTVVSVYSADAEGEDATNDVEIIDLTQNPSHHDVPGSPPLGESEDLFSPPPSPVVPKKRKLIRVMDCVQIPRLSKEKKERYKPISTLAKRRRDHADNDSALQPTRSLSGVQAHDDLTAALNSAIENNHGASSSPTRLIPKRLEGQAPSALPSSQSAGVPKRKRKPNVEHHIDLTSALNSTMDNNDRSESPEVPKRSNQLSGKAKQLTRSVSSAHVSQSLGKEPNDPRPPNPRRPPHDSHLLNPSRIAYEPTIDDASTSKPQRVAQSSPIPSTSRTTKPKQGKTHASVSSPPPPSFVPPFPKRPAKRKKEEDHPVPQTKKPRAKRKLYPPLSDHEPIYLFSSECYYSELECWLNLAHLLPPRLSKVDANVLKLSMELDQRGDPFYQSDDEGHNCEYSRGEWWMREFEDVSEDEGEAVVRIRSRVPQEPEGAQSFTPEIPLTKDLPSRKEPKPVPSPPATLAPTAIVHVGQLVNLPKSPPIPLLSEKARGKQREVYPPPSPPPLGIEARSPSRMNVGAKVANFLRPAHPAALLGPPPNPALNAYRNPESTNVLLSSLSSAPYDDLGGSFTPATQDGDSAEMQHSAYFSALDSATTEDVTSSYSMSTLEQTWDSATTPGYQPADTIYPMLLQPQGHEHDDQDFMNLDDEDMGLVYPEDEELAQEPAGVSPMLVEPPRPEAGGGELGGSEFGNDAYGPAGAGSMANRRTSSPSSSESSVSSRAVTPPAAGPSNVSGTVRQPRSRTPSELDLGPMPVYKSDSDDADWEGSDSGLANMGRGKRKKRPTKPKRLPWLTDGIGDEDDDALELESNTVKTKGPPKTTMKKAQGTAIGPPKNFPWEKGDSEAYCHQCRSKSFRLKMACSSCVALYCNRCIAGRYPDVQFSLEFAPETCFRCRGICNCDICCRKRGEKFLSSKVAGSRPSAVVTLEPMTTRPKKQVQQPAKKRREPSISSVLRVPSGSMMDVEQWGTVYGLDGSKMQVTFVDESESDEGDEWEHGEAPVPQQQQEDVLEEFKPRRVFIGKFRPSWRMGTKPIIQLLEPEDPGVAEWRKNRGEGERVKLYSGKPLVLRPPLPRPRLRGDSETESEEEDEDEVDEEGGVVGVENKDEDAFLSPLTSLPDTEDDGKNYSPDSLTDSDIASAILVSLRSLASSANNSGPITPITPVD